MVGRQKYEYIQQPLVPQPSTFGVEIAIAEHTSLGSDKIPAELIQVGEETLRSEIHKLINCIWNKVELTQHWNESLIAPVYKKGDKISSSFSSRL
jgi:hypothetical protein